MAEVECQKDKREKAKPSRLEAGYHQVGSRPEDDAERRLSKAFDVLFENALAIRDIHSGEVEKFPAKSQNMEHHE